MSKGDNTSSNPSGDATTSFDGYIYQADVALLVALLKILELRNENGENFENILEDYSLEIEGEEDFSILIDKKYHEIYQVKSYKHIEQYRERYQYKIPIKKLVEKAIQKDCKAFFCTYLPILHDDGKKYSCEELLQYCFSADSDENKKKCFNPLEILGRGEEANGQNYFGDYGEIQGRIKEVLKEITGNNNNNLVELIFQYLSVKIKKYIQKKALYQKKGDYDTKIYIPFVELSKDKLGFSEGIYSLLSEIDEGVMITKLTTDDKFIHETVLKLLIQDINEIDLQAVYYKFESLENWQIIDDFENKGREILNIFIECLINNPSKLDYFRSCIDFSSINIGKLKGQNFINFIKYGNINSSKLEYFVGNIIVYQLTGGNIYDIFEKNYRSILGDEPVNQNYTKLMLEKLLKTNFVFSFEKDIYSLYNSLPGTYKAENCEEKFRDEKAGQLVTKSKKDIKVCCFKCPHNKKNHFLINHDCGKEDCDLYTK